MKTDLNRIGILILVGIFLCFYVITTVLLDKRNLTRDIPPIEEEKKEEVDTHEEEINIIKNLYNDFRILYDVVNNKYIVSQDETITIGDIVYKKITNFDSVTSNIFTEKGLKKYIDDLKNYFAVTEDGYYLAGNLVNYQTYYFRGDNTNIFIIDSSDNLINAIIYEKWVAGNKDTLATIRVINNEGKWLVDDISILLAE